MLEGADRPVSHHDSEAEAHARRDAYARGTHPWAVAELAASGLTGFAPAQRDTS